MLSEFQLLYCYYYYFIIILPALEGKGVAFISASLVAGPECQSKSIKLRIE